MIHLQLKIPLESNTQEKRALVPLGEFSFPEAFNQHFSVGLS
jgi:hypothetical protein